MEKSKTSQALDWLKQNPDSNPHAAAVRFGITPSGLYNAIRRRAAQRACPCCGHTIKVAKP